ncbi:dynein axonemal light chain 1 isoform X3 [Octopus bimaculoides]|uniref:dynein axonemal light chain 1 isoform X3 n=1 Tax=Octopus bimaculoides TaxID=37653 RepID=UPI0022E7C3DD|nr:dynein axonemal light chain 1 isoform X3 [Octopus bimaculoides]
MSTLHVNPIKAAKPTSIREAISRWEKENEGQKAVEAKVLNFSFQVPFIEKIDPTVTTLAACEHLSLSTNNIEKIANLNGLKNLKILSLGRNKIKVLTGLDAVGETLEQLWISYNSIEKLKGINVLKNLRVLYMSNNVVSDWNEFNKLELSNPSLYTVWMVGIEVEVSSSEGRLAVYGCPQSILG